MNWDNIVLAVIAAVPGTLVALGSYRSSVKTRREVVKQTKKAEDFMETVAVTTAALQAAQTRQAKQKPTFREGSP